MRCERVRLKIIFLAVFIVGLFALTSQAYAANWYASNAAQGSHNGTSWSNAWSLSQIVWGTGGVQAGDTLYLDGGTTSQTYTSGFTVRASGTSGSPITIRVGQDPGHNGEVIFDFDALGDSGTGAAITVSNYNYLVIDGSVGTGRKLTIKNLRNTTTRHYATGIEANTSSYLTVKYVTIDNCNNGIHAVYGAGYDFNNNRFTGIRGNVAMAIVSSTAGSWDVNSIHDNYIGLVWNQFGPDGVEISHGTNVYNNTFRVDTVTYAIAGWHTDFVQLQGNYVKVYNNEFINIGDSGIDSDSGYSADYRAPHDIWIFNNTFRIIADIDLYPEYIRFYGCDQTLTNIKILNNTFVDNPNWAAVYFNCDASATGSGNEIKNNIWYNSGLGEYTPALRIRGAGISFDIDSNIYYGGAYIEHGGTRYTAANWLLSHEPHSSTIQPAFVYYAARNHNNDLHLSPSDNVAKDHGTALSAYFTTDKDGNARSGSWDIGAYEFISGAPVMPPAAPGGLTVQ